MKTRQLKIRAVALLCGAFALLAGTGVKADTITYNLDTTPNSGLTQYAPVGTVFGTIKVDLNVSGTIATITETAGSYGGTTFGFVDGGTFAGNILSANPVAFAFVSATALPGFAAVNSAGIQASTLPQTPTPPGTNPAQVDGQGKFNTIVDQSNASNPQKEVIFTLTRGSGIWASAANVFSTLASTGQTSLVAAHLGGYICTATNCVTAPFTGNGNTGFVSGSAVPIPAALLFVGPALAGLGFVGLKKKQGVVGFGGMAA